MLRIKNDLYWDHEKNNFYAINFPNKFGTGGKKMSKSLFKYIITKKYGLPIP